MMEFIHNRKTFEICITFTNEELSVSIFSEGKQVTPVYTANIEVAQDYYQQHREHILDQLVELAKTDIIKGRYIQ